MVFSGHFKNEGIWQIQKKYFGPKSELFILSVKVLFEFVDEE